ncbi:MAG: FAD:protein FMN transferase [Clostridia bacterium]|nr:FAD:protein FMN transferase [Clostridia bacterium]
MGTIEKMFIALGTVNRITAWFDAAERESARLALERAEEYINDMDDRLSVFKPDSEISRINENAGVRDTLVCRDTFELLKLCVKYGELTGGVFDITTKPLTEASGNGARVNYHDVLLDDRGLSVRLRSVGEGIHLGGIAKGYAVDTVARILERGGVRHAVINLGGTVRNTGRAGTVGIRNPFEPEKTALTIESVDEAVVTSGLYERGNHIFDPVSGRPAVSDIASVTVVGNDGAAADAAATACMVIGSVRSVRLLDFLGLDGIFILRNGDIFATKSLLTRVKSA